MTRGGGSGIPHPHVFDFHAQFKFVGTRKPHTKCCVYSKLHTALKFKLILGVPGRYEHDHRVTVFFMAFLSRKFKLAVALSET